MLIQEKFCGHLYDLCTLLFFQYCCHSVLAPMLWHNNNIIAQRFTRKAQCMVRGPMLSKECFCTQTQGILQLYQVNNVVDLSAGVFFCVKKSKDISYRLIFILTKYTKEQMVQSFPLNTASGI